MSKTFDSIKRNYRRRFSILKENRRHVCLTHFSVVCLSFPICSYTRSWNQTPDCRYRSSSDPVFPATAAALHRTSGSVPLHVAARSGSDRRLRDLMPKMAITWRYIFLVLQICMLIIFFHQAIFSMILPKMSVILRQVLMLAIMIPKLLPIVCWTIGISLLIGKVLPFII